MRPMPAPLGLYIHIPFCKSKCVYCDFYSLAGREDRMDAYQKALLAHIRETAPLAQRIAYYTSCTHIIYRKRLSALRYKF